MNFMNTKPTLYFIPGLAANKSIFRNLRLQDYKCVYLEWEDPLPGEDIAAFAKRFSRHIDDSEPFVLIGSSLGGIMSVEMSQYIDPQLIILVSSAMNKKELPRFFVIFRILPLYRILPFSWIRRLIKVIRKLAGKLDAKENELVLEMLNKSSPKFFRWASHQVLFWKRKDEHPKVVHIHGTKDRLFPIKRIKDPIPIEGGNHFMVMYEGKKISGVILNLLQGKVD